KPGRGRWASRPDALGRAALLPALARLRALPAADLGRLRLGGMVGAGSRSGSLDAGAARPAPRERGPRLRDRDPAAVLAAGGARDGPRLRQRAGACPRCALGCARLHDGHPARVLPWTVGLAERHAALARARYAGPPWRRSTRPHLRRRGGASPARSSSA